jgi:hypothetical protein
MGIASPRRFEYMREKKKLSDILLHSQQDRLVGIWDNARPADDLRPIPPGEYRCMITDGSLSTARSGTLGYKLTLEVMEGEHAGRRLWHDIWLTEAAISLAKRDLGKLGITSLEQLERPLPEGIIVVARVALRRGDNGEEFNRITRFEVIGIEPPSPEPFAPKPAGTVEPERANDPRDQHGFNYRTSRYEDSAPTALSGGNGQP